MTSQPGRVVILNGPPRVGKSSIATAMADLDGRRWVPLGVDAVMESTPAHLRPGIGLRPGGERPDLEPFVQGCCAALFETIAALSRRGIDVVSDLGIHDGYTRPLGILADAAERFAATRVHLVGVHCSTGETLARRAAAPGRYATDRRVIEHWSAAVHHPGIYDIELDTTHRTATDCAGIVLRHVERTEPEALRRIREGR